MSASSWYFKRFFTFSSKNFRWWSLYFSLKIAEFINFEVETIVIDADDGKKDDEVSNVSKNFCIEDQEIGTNVDFYREFTNVEKDLDQVLAEVHNEALTDIEQFDEISNLCDGSDSETQIDEFKDSKIDITKFKDTLFPRVDESQEKIENQFCKAVLYAIKFNKNGTKVVWNKSCLEQGGSWKYNW